MNCESGKNDFTGISDAARHIRFTLERKQAVEFIVQVLYLARFRLVEGVWQAPNGLLVDWLVGNHQSFSANNGE